MKIKDENALRSAVEAQWGPAGWHADVLAGLMRRARFADAVLEFLREHPSSDFPSDEYEAWCAELGPRVESALRRAELSAEPEEKESL